jgi:uncharacterized membrane protein YqiK
VLVLVAVVVMVVVVVLMVVVVLVVLLVVMVVVNVVDMGKLLIVSPGTKDLNAKRSVGSGVSMIRNSSQNKPATKVVSNFSDLTSSACDDEVD